MGGTRGWTARGRAWVWARAYGLSTTMHSVVLVSVVLAGMLPPQTITSRIDEDPGRDAYIDVDIVVANGEVDSAPAHVRRRVRAHTPARRPRSPTALAVEREDPRSAPNGTFEAPEPLLSLAPLDTYAKGATNEAVGSEIASGDGRAAYASLSKPDHRIRRATLSTLDASYLRVQESYPSLPVSLRRAGARYALAVEVCIGVNGRVDRVAVLQSAHADLDRVVVQAIRSWRYRPLIVDSALASFCHMLKIDYSFGS